MATFLETAPPAWLEIDMRHGQNNERGGKSRMEWFATLLRQAAIADSMRDAQGRGVAARIVTRRCACRRLQ
jgi:hypothetical protein